MGILTDRLDNMVLRVMSPDNMIMAKVEKRFSVSLAFRPDTYASYRPTVLEHQLARLGTLVWTGYQRGYYMALSEATGQKITGPGKTWDPNRRRFREEQAATVFKAVSPGGWIRCENVGMLNWSVRLKDGALDRLDERAFVSEATETVRRLIADYRAKMIVLKDEHYGLDLPPGLRMRKGALRPRPTD